MQDMIITCPYCNRNLDLDFNSMRDVTAVMDDTGNAERINCPFCGKWFEIYYK